MEGSLLPIRKFFLSHIQILSQSHSNSMNQNKKQAARLLSKFSEKYGQHDPIFVSVPSFTLILNLLND